MCRAKRHPKNKKMHTVEQRQESDDSDSDEMFIGTVEMSGMDAVGNSKGDTDRWSEVLLINEKKVTFRIDTGADCNVMSAKTLKTLNQQPAAS